MKTFSKASRRAVLVLALTTPAHALDYHLVYPSNGAARVEIRIESAEPMATPQILAIPRAIPMGYGEQPYDRFISGVRAFSPAGKPLAVERLDGPRWRLGAPQGELSAIRYDVDIGWMENTIRSAADSSKVRPGYAGMLGYSVFTYLEGHEGDRQRLTVSGPPRWSVFSTLAPAVPRPGEVVKVEAADFYVLADSQIAMGRHLAVREVRAKAPLFVVTFAEGKLDQDIVEHIARTALNELIDYFGEAPFPHYTIYAEFLSPVSRKHDYGFGMAHLDSATFFFDNTRLLNAETESAAVRRMLYEFAHHVAHSWIPKRCAGQGYSPFPWEFAPVLDTVWFSEGFAQYVALAAVRDKALDPLDRLLDQRFRSTLADAPPAIRRMSTVELSRVASTRYREDFRTGRNSFSRGGMMAAEIDSLIRERSGGKKTLRDTMRHLFAWCRQNSRGFRTDEIPGLLEKGSGVDVRAIFDRWMAPQPED